MEDTDRKLAVLLSTNYQFNGYVKINAHVICYDPQKSSDYTYSLDYRLQPSDYVCESHRIEVGIASQMGIGNRQDDIEPMLDPYAIRVGVKAPDDIYLSSQHMANLAKASRLLHLRMDKITLRLGETDQLPELIVRLGLALRCQYAYREGAYYDAPLHIIEADDARVWVEQAITDARRKLYPATAT